MSDTQLDRELFVAHRRQKARQFWLRSAPTSLPLALAAVGIFVVVLGVFASSPGIRHQAQTFARGLFGGVHAPQFAQTTSAALAVAETETPLSPAPSNFSSQSGGQATTTTIVNNYITQPIIERERLASPLGISEQTLASRLTELRDELTSRIAAMASAPLNFSGPAATTPVSGATFAPSQRIDYLSNVTISNATVSGVTGLTDADLPDSITASNYLTLTGGTLSGNLAVTGNFTVAGAQTLSGAITVPYITATSTAATSTFAGGLAIETSGLVYDYSSNRVGIGTAAPSTNFHVKGTTDVATIQATNSPGNKFLSFEYSDTGSTYGNFQMQVGTLVLQAGAFDGKLQFTPYNGGTYSSSLGLIVDTTGNVGIGTTTPSGKLTVTNTGSDASFIVEDSVSDSTPFVIDNFGRVSIWGNQVGNHPLTLNITENGRGVVLGDRAVNGTMYIGRTSGGGFGGNSGWIGFGGDGTTSNNWLDFSGYGSTPQMRITSTGNVGVGTTTPWRTLSVTGTVGFDGLTGATGAGSLCLSSTKEVVYNSASDACLSSTRATKHDIDPLVLDALSQVLALAPVSFIYNEGDGRVRYGFIAEDTAAVDAHLVTYNASSTVSGIDDRAVLSVIVAAVKQIYASLTELASAVTDFGERFTTRELTFTRATGDDLTLKRLCLEDVCITKPELQRLLDQAGQNSSPAPSPLPETPEQESETLSDGLNEQTPADVQEPESLETETPMDAADAAEILPQVADAPAIILSEPLNELLVLKLFESPTTLPPSALQVSPFWFLPKFSWRPQPDGRATLYRAAKIGRATETRLPGRARVSSLRVTIVAASER